MNKPLKSIQIGDLLQPKPAKKKSFIHENFLDKMTPQEQAQWRVDAIRKRAATMAARKAEKAALVEKARALIPEIMAHELMAEDMDNPNWTPKQDLIDKIKSLINRGLTIDEMRAKHFKGVKDSNWERITKFVLKSINPTPESSALDIRAAFEATVITLRKRVDEIKKEIKLFKKENPKKNVPAYLLSMKYDAEDRFLMVTESSHKSMHQVGGVGEKSKAPVIHFHSSTPRPTKEEKQEKVIEGAVEVVG